MKLGSLFSGGGLGDFGFLAAGIDVAWQCEIDEACQKRLVLRYPESKKYTDIKKLKGAELEKVDIISGGFPCQPFSVAGRQKGKDDNRYLWPEMFRIIKECRPRWVVGENVTGIINMELHNVCADLEKEGYKVGEPIVFPSHALGAWHKRDRVWIIANATDARVKGMCEWKDASSKIISNTINNGLYSKKTYAAKSSSNRKNNRLFIGDGFWPTKSGICGVAHGIADRVHRLKMLGNGQVPACTYVIGKMIMDIEFAPANEVGK